jgi:hypothetical protein
MIHRVVVLPQAKGVKSPGFTKTGTTIAGIIFKVSRPGGAGYTVFDPA